MQKKIVSRTAWVDPAKQGMSPQETKIVDEDRRQCAAAVGPSFANPPPDVAPVMYPFLLPSAPPPVAAVVGEDKSDVAVENESSKKRDAPPFAYILVLAVLLVAVLYVNIVHVYGVDEGTWRPKSPRALHVFDSRPIRDSAPVLDHSSPCQEIICNDGMCALSLNPGAQCTVDSDCLGEWRCNLSTCACHFPSRAEDKPAYTAPAAPRAQPIHNTPSAAPIHNTPPPPRAAPIYTPPPAAPPHAPRAPQKTAGEGWSLPPDATLVRHEQRQAGTRTVHDGTDRVCHDETVEKHVKVYAYTERVCYDDGSCDNTDHFDTVPRAHDEPVFKTYYYYYTWRK